MKEAWPLCQTEGVLPSNILILILQYYYGGEGGGGGVKKKQTVLYFSHTHTC